MPAELEGPEWKQKWQRVLDERCKELKGQAKYLKVDKEVLEQVISGIEDRRDQCEGCHLLERFRIVDDTKRHEGVKKKDGHQEAGLRFEVVFKEQSDHPPSNIQQEKEALENFSSSETAREELPQLVAALLKAVNLPAERANLRGAHLQYVQLQGVCLEKANLQGADLRGADLRGANLKKAQLQAADLRGAKLRGANLDGASLHGATLVNAELQDVKFRLTDLTGANLFGADLTGAQMMSAEWQKGKAPICLNIKCPRVPLGSFSKKARHESAGQMMKQMFLGREDREELDDTEDETDETTKGVPSDQEDTLYSERSECVPLLDCCGSSIVPVDVEPDLLKRFETAVQQVERHLGDGDMAQVKVLRKMMEEMKKDTFTKNVEPLLKAQAQAKEAKAEPELITTLEELARLADKPTGGKFTKAVTDFAAQLIKVEGLAVPEETCDKAKDTGSKEAKVIVTRIKKLIDFQLTAPTSYSSGFACFIPPFQMTSDLRELEDMLGHIEKLQETVNVNNWDDIIDNFVCMLKLQSQLTGERSRSVFLAMWKGEKLRQSVGVAKLFQEVNNHNDPPNFVMHKVKDAVQVVKEDALAWRTALKKEITSINRAKARQDFLIQCICQGILVFFSTTLSLLISLFLRPYVEKKFMSGSESTPPGE